MFDWFDLAGAGTALAYLIEVTGKSIVVFLVAAVVVVVYRKSSAADRHRIWFAALAGVILFPILTAVLPSWGVIGNPSWMEELRNADTELSNPMSALGSSAVPAIPLRADRGSSSDSRLFVPETENASDPKSVMDAQAVPTPGGQIGGNDSSSGSPVLEALSAFIARVKTMHWTTMVFWIWLLGALAVLSQLITGAVGVLFLARRATPIRDPQWLDLIDEIGDRLFLKRDVHLLKSRDTSMPMTWGGVNPVVLVPTDADSWTDEKRRCVLTHELAHIKRWDCATQGIAQLVCAIYWFNPLVWIAAKRLRVEREKACDDYVITSGAQASNYANHLLDIARSLKSSILPPLGAVSMARPSQLEGRVLAILDPSPRKHRFSTPAKSLVGILTLCVVFPLAAMVPEATSELDGDMEIEVALYSGLDAVRMAQSSEKSISDNVDLSKRATAVRPDRDYASPDTTDREKRRLRLVKAFTTALSDEDSEIRQNAAHMLGKIGKDDSVAPLGRVLTSDEDDDVREQAAWALGEIGSSSAANTLINALEDSEVDVRRQAVWALGEIESSSALSALLRMLSTESDSETKELVIWSIGQIEDDRAVSGLADAYDSESSRDVREKVIWALGEIESLQAVPTLRKAATDEDPEIRTMAIWALTELEDVESIPTLRRALKDSHPEVRQRAVWGLAEMEDEASVEALIEATKDTDQEVREMAIRGLGELEDNRALDVLVDALGDSKSDIRHAAVRALGELEDDRAVPGLSRALKNDDEETREMAAWALGEIESEQAVSALMEATVDDSRSVRKSALWALAEIEDERAIPALIQAANDKDDEVREIVIHALSEFESVEIEAIFIESLQDEVEDIRQMAAHGLSEYSSDRAVAALGRVLASDTSIDVKEQAAHTLGEIGTENAIILLEKALQDDDAAVRKAATRALSRVDFSYNSDYDSEQDIEEFADAVALVGESIADATVAGVSYVTTAIASLELDTIVIDATEESLESIDWSAVEIAVENALMEVDQEIDATVVEVLIQIVEENPDGRASRKALRALQNSDHPNAQDFIRDRKK